MTYHPHSSARRRNIVLKVLAFSSFGCLVLPYILGFHLDLYDDQLKAIWRKRLAHQLSATEADTENGISVESKASSNAQIDYEVSFPEIDAEDRIIIQFSTDCTSFQHWQAMTMLESAERVGQRGAIVRVVCGCEKKASLTGDDQLTKEQIQAEHAAFAEHPSSTPRFRFHLIFVDDMTHVANTSERYKFANKAQSLHFWLDKMGGGILREVVGPDASFDESDEDVVVISIDPDFLFMTPFGPRELGLLPSASWGTNSVNEAPKLRQTNLSDEIFFRVPKTGREVIAQMRGRPTAQAYSLSSVWRELPVCKEDTDGCSRVSFAEANQFYNVGPPYALHRADWLSFIDEWTAVIPLAHAQYSTVSEDKTKHYAEMFAWAIAAAKLHLPHTLLDMAMVGCMRNWPAERIHKAVSALQKNHAKDRTFRCGLDSPIVADNVGLAVSKDEKTSETGVSAPVSASDRLPAFLHYCEQCRMEEEGRVWWWYKRMLPADLIFDCGPHLVELPPSAMFGSSKEAFVSCTLIEIVNACKRRFRRSSLCQSAANATENESHNVKIIPKGGHRRIREGEWHDVPAK